MNTTNTLHNINTLAADALDKHGWTQGEMQEDDGSMCLVGALRHCSPQPGDWLIACEVYQGLDHAEEWNDEKGRTKAEVTAWLREHPITDANLEDTFGPQWQAIVALIRQAATLTREQADAIHAAWDAARLAPSDATRAAAREAARATLWTASRNAAREATWTAAREATGIAAGHAAALAADALAVADLVGQHGLTQDHIDTLMGPWVSVMGDPRSSYVIIGYTGEEGVTA